MSARLVGVLLVTAIAFLPLSASAIGMRESPGEQAYLDLANNSGKHRPGTAAPDFAPVAAIGFTDDLGFDVVGSGVLVGANWILTAAHVVLDTENTAEGSDGYLDQLIVRFGSDLRQPGAEYRIVELFTPRPARPGYLAFAEPPPHGMTDADLIGAEFADIALARLDRPVTGIAPATMSPRGPSIGQRLFIAGYGEAAFGTELDETLWQPPALRRAAENILDRDIAIDPFTGRRDRGGLLMFDFDNGTGPRNSLGLMSDAYWLAIAGRGSSDETPLPLEGSSYPGDSGGPAFAFLDAAWRIVGVSSGGSGWPVNGRREGLVQYGDILFYTRVASHAKWIRKILLSR
ncbi:MAG: trypsin-like peptidase domain-containing protein [Alphaproteobacteria bacterium]